MIYSTCRKTWAAGICDQGREEGLAALARDGHTMDTVLPMTWGLEVSGVPGTLWAMGTVNTGSRDEAQHALVTFILRTTERFLDGGSGMSRAHTKLAAFLRGAKINLNALKETLRAQSIDDHNDLYRRAVALMFYRAMQDKPLNLRAAEVAEQAMLAATHGHGHVVPDTNAYKAEYQLQYDALMAILTGEDQ